MAVSVSGAPTLGRETFNAERFAIQLMIGQGALFAAETAVVHHLGLGASVFQLALIRGVAGMVLAVILARKCGLAFLQTRQMPLQLARGAVSLLYLWVMIYSFGHLPFADATAISFTQAAYITLFSVLILGERVTATRWLAAGLGIFGAALIAKPGFTNWDSAYVVALLGTGLNGLAFVLNKYLQRADSDTTTMFYTNLVIACGCLPFLQTTIWPALNTVYWLPAVFFLGPIGMFLGIVAVKHANASALAPYTLLRLLMGVVVGLVVFREVPDFSSMLGAILIVGCCVLSCRHPASARATLVIPTDAGARS